MIFQKVKETVMNNWAIYRLYRASRLDVLYNYYYEHRVHSLVKFSKLKIPDGKVVEHNGIKLRINPTSVQDLQFITFNGKNIIYEPETGEFLRQYVKDGSVFVDAGANNGYFSLLVARLLKGTGKVYSFEPVATTYKRLLQNIELNGFSNIEPYNFALGSYRHDAFINVSDTNDGFNSLVEIRGSRTRIAVDVIPLDEIVGNNRVDIIKMDVEGYEREVIKGATNVIRSNENIKVIFEHNPALSRHGNEDEFNLLKRLGFKIYSMDISKGNLIFKEISNIDKIGGGNFLAVRKL